MKLYKYSIFVLIIVSLSGCSSPDKKANKLFVEATSLYTEGQLAEYSSYALAYEKYSSILDILENIVHKYPETDIAVRISEGNIRIGDYSLSTYKSRYLPNIKIRAEAESDLLLAATFVAFSMDNDWKKVQALIDLSSKMHE